MTHLNEQLQPVVFFLQPPASPATKHSTTVNSDDTRLDDGEDSVLAMKLQCVNNAIDEIGFTTYQLKLFFLNGFGYAVDSLLILLNALTQPQVALQYQPRVSKAQTIAVGIGLLAGALFWGLGADVSRCSFCFDTYVDRRSNNINYVNLFRSLAASMHSILRCSFVPFLPQLPACRRITGSSVYSLDWWLLEGAVISS